MGKEPYKTQDFHSFAEYYPYYLTQHRSYINRCIHVVSSSFCISFLLYQLFFGKVLFILLCPCIDYFPAWIGHFYFEQNKPATFNYPYLSYLGDYVMIKDVLLGRIPMLFEKYDIEGKA
mmetsp:Transcript_33800/g.35103  ORF Transcript_33800/g.35103 Transcript_33800/m.35103 type:complete len:119 (+) Transcript_33800:17-373(+)